VQRQVSRPLLSSKPPAGVFGGSQTPPPGQAGRAGWYLLHQDLALLLIILLLSFLLHFFFSGKVNNDNFHPCPVQGACAFDNQTCAAATPYSLQQRQLRRPRQLQAGLRLRQGRHHQGVFSRGMPAPRYGRHGSDLPDPVSKQPSLNPDLDLLDLLHPDHGAAGLLGCGLSKRRQIWMCGDRCWYASP